MTKTLPNGAVAARQALLLLDVTPDLSEAPCGWQPHLILKVTCLTVPPGGQKTSTSKSLSTFIAACSSHTFLDSGGREKSSHTVVLMSGVQDRPAQSRQQLLNVDLAGITDLHESVPRLAKPKSAIFRYPVQSATRFSGFRSRACTLDKTVCGAAGSSNMGRRP